MDQKPVAPCKTQYILSGMVRRILLLPMHESSRKWKQSILPTLLLVTWKLDIVVSDYKSPQSEPDERLKGLSAVNW